jgi:hypothetical protein
MSWTIYELGFLISDLDCRRRLGRRVRFVLVNGIGIGDACYKVSQRDHKLQAHPGWEVNERAAE